MTKIRMHYEGDLLFRAAHEGSGTVLLTDAPIDNHGKGRSFSPTDLVATALGACMGTIIGIVAERDGINITGMTIAVEKIMTALPRRRIGALNVEISIPQPVSPADRKKLETAAQTCPVHHSLHPQISVNVHYEWR